MTSAEAVAASLGAYRDLPRGVRLHTRVRAATCPFPPLLERVRPEGRLLDVGCGHGLFARAAALFRPRLRVLGIDPAPGKIAWARAAAPVAGVSFREAALEEVDEQVFDVVSLLDVLYLVPRSDWPGFLAACRRRLRPEGTLLLKEVAPRPRWKFYRCLLQETVSVRLLGITLGASFAFAERAEMVALLEAVGFARVATTPLDRGYLTPHVLYEATA